MDQNPITYLFFFKKKLVKNSFLTIIFDSRIPNHTSTYKKDSLMLLYIEVFIFYFLKNGVKC
jgi:hypothetical protein